MPKSIERIVMGISMYRVLSIATLLLVVACLIISASIAFAQTPGAVPLDAKAWLDASTAPIDIYEFDFPIEAEALPNPEFDDVTIPEEI